MRPEKTLLPKLDKENKNKKTMDPVKLMSINEKILNKYKQIAIYKKR